MPTIDERAAATALAGGAIAAALLETLMDKDILSRAEARAILQRALTTVGTFSQAPGGPAAGSIITSMLSQKFSARG